MEAKLRALYRCMFDLNGGEPALIQHLTKVHAYAKLIAEEEGVDAHTLYILEAAALAHDIAIPLCRKKYGSDAGAYQELEGPALVEANLPPLGFSEEEVSRVAWLVGHHHTVMEDMAIDHQILIEADFFVNAFEGNLGEDAKRTTLEKVFRTETGKALFRTMFAL